MGRRGWKKLEDVRIGLKRAEPWRREEMIGREFLVG